MKRFKIAFEVYDLDQPKGPIFDKKQIIVEFSEHDLTGDHAATIRRGLVESALAEAIKFIEIQLREQAI